MAPTATAEGETSPGRAVEASASEDAQGDTTGANGAAAHSRTAGASAARAAGEPDWMRVDETAKKVEFDIVAGLTSENSSWNFNGYANGDMTISVPTGWSVVMNFSNRDGDVPHSVYILEQGPPYPTVMPERPAISRAYSSNLQNGLGAGKTDVLRFTSGPPGKYTMPCGVLGHAAAGMWDHFVVSAEAERPGVQFAS